jgi:hypothetical protein
MVLAIWNRCGAAPNDTDTKVIVVDNNTATALLTTDEKADPLLIFHPF